MTSARNPLRRPKRTAAFAVWTMMAAIGIGGVVLLALGVFIAMNISKMLSTVIGEAARLSDDAVDGKLQTRGNPDLVSREFRPILEGFNATLDAVVGPLNVTAKYVDRISKGDIPEKITDRYNGDFNEIKNNLNQCIDAHQRPDRAKARPWRRPRPTANSTPRPTRRGSRASSATSSTA